jgi:hypothetical protein
VRFLMALALTYPVCLYTAFAQSDSDTASNTDCIERLRMPAYPQLANLARIAGGLNATVRLNPDGSIQDTVLDSGTSSASAKSLFTPAVEKALRASAFRKGCGGKSVRLIFNFILGEELDQNHLPQTVSFGYPNRFWISVPPPIMQP